MRFLEVPRHYIHALIVLKRQVNLDISLSVHVCLFLVTCTYINGPFGWLYNDVVVFNSSNMGCCFSFFFFVTVDVN